MSPSSQCGCHPPPSGGSHPLSGRVTLLPVRVSPSSQWACHPPPSGGSHPLSGHVTLFTVVLSPSSQSAPCPRPHLVIVGFPQPGQLQFVVRLAVAPLPPSVSRGAEGLPRVGEVSRTVVTCSQQPLSHMRTQVHRWTANTANNLHSVNTGPLMDGEHSQLLNVNTGPCVDGEHSQLLNVNTGSCVDGKHSQLTQVHVWTANTVNFST